ncbi:MAG: hypothetical protein AAF066_12040 [Pseudomonadota bacterium]
MGFIRFITPKQDQWSRVETGIFQCGLDLWYEDTDTSCLITKAIRSELEWFNEHLDCPDRFFYRVGKKAERSGVCWFKDESGEHVRRARNMAQLLAKLGAETRQIRCEYPGTILWQDSHQVVALPDRASKIFKRPVH